MAPVLGDFLRPAGEHIAAAARYSGELPVPVKRAVITELDRLVARLARYLDDLALPADFTPASTADPAMRAALDARLALHQASASLQPAAAAAREGPADNGHPAVRHLSSANSYLAAGRDLLQTHFTTGPAGDRRHLPVGHRDHLSTGHQRTADRTRPQHAAARRVDRAPGKRGLPVCGPARRGISGAAYHQPVAAHRRSQRSARATTPPGGLARPPAARRHTCEHPAGAAAAP
jgi:hypothetical protein